LSVPVLYVPCFAGAPWDLSRFPALADRPGVTPALPVADTLDAYADWLEEAAVGLGRFVLVGDSFGAAIALAFAARKPPALRAVVASGGFATNPVAQPWLVAAIRHGPHLSGGAYERMVLPWHARLLRSRFDREGDRPWSVADTLALFRRHTPAEAYWARARAAVDADLTDSVLAIEVPTLVLSPEDDRLVASPASAALRRIPHAVHRVLPRTGHMVRFSHPTAYGAAVDAFLREVVHDGGGPPRLASV
jgi:pimeloyl-ACP methyl ester carboxylesterase